MKNFPRNISSPRVNWNKTTPTTRENTPCYGNWFPSTGTSKITVDKITVSWSLYFFSASENQFTVSFKRSHINHTSHYYSDQGLIYEQPVPFPLLNKIKIQVSPYSSDLTSGKSSPCHKYLVPIRGINFYLGQKKKFILGLTHFYN